MRIIKGKPSTFVTQEAKAFKQAVQLVARGRSIEAKSYEAAYCVYQGHGSRGDVDNYAKCILDALVAAAVIPTDAAVTDLHASKRRDRNNPRTEITVRAANKEQQAA